MTEIFRSEILAVVMNQLVDEPNLPTLFLRTVRHQRISHLENRMLENKHGPLTRYVIGHPSSDDIPLAARLRLNNAALATDHQEDLDESAPLGGFHPLREAHCPCEFRCSAPASERTVTRGRGEAAESQGRVARARHEEGHE